MRDWVSEMSMPNQVKVKHLVEEAKKRIVFLVICVVGLSYLLSCKFPAIVSVVFIWNFWFFFSFCG